MPSKKAPLLAVIAGLILLVGCFWVIANCFRLITGRKNRGGLMSPNTLRVVAFLFAGAPDWRIIHRLLSRNGCRGHISSCDVFFRLSGSLRIGSEAGGLRVSKGRAKERSMLNRR
jgi:hypothetical protein